jgi:hypothetical protein
MHSTRVATFLLGAWIGCCVFLDLLAIQNFRLAGQMLNAAIPAASEIIETAGRGQAGLLLRHFAAEQYRYYFSLWGWIQLPVILLLAGVLYVATEKRILPQILCLAMLALVVFELSIHSELVYRGREADFPPGSLALGTQARVLALMEIWGGAETVKLAAGGVLAAFIFSYRSTRRSRRSSDPVTLVRAD